MNKKKLILLIGIGIIVLILIVTALILGSGSKNSKKKISANNFKIWIVGDPKDIFFSFVEDFKKDTKNTSFAPVIESFDNYEEYNLALASAFAKGEAPDLFMLNNNEKSLFLENAIGIDPSVISPDDLRNNFKGFFAEDLILSSGNKEDKTEFLAGVPFGYEVLGTFFNFRKVQNVKDLQNFSYIDGLIDEKSKDNFSVIGIGEGTSVVNSSDIFTQFLMTKADSINNVNSSILKESLSSYFGFASGKNNYSDLELKAAGKNNIEAFTEGKIAAIFAYPRDLEKINDYGFSKNFLRATTFPEFINDSKKLVKYNYFVINKNSMNKDMALEFLSYLFSEKGEKAILKKFKYYLPARMSLYDEILNRDILDNYHIKLSSFYNSEALYSSFDKGFVGIYDKDITRLLDKKSFYLESFIDFYDRMTCMTGKILRLENLSKSCE